MRSAQGMPQLRQAERQECDKPKGKGQPACCPLEGPPCPGAVCTAFLGGKWPKHREDERMEKVTRSEGFLKPLISHGSGGNSSASSTDGSARGLGRGDCALGSELGEPQGGRLTQQAIMVGLPC